MFANSRRGRQERNLTTNVPKILHFKSSFEQIFFLKLMLGAPDLPWLRTHNTHRRQNHAISRVSWRTRGQVSSWCLQRKYKGALVSRKQLTNRVEELLMQFMKISRRNTGRCGSGFVKTRLNPEKCKALVLAPKPNARDLLKVLPYH